MRSFKIFLLFVLFIVGCQDSNSTQMCPECHMPISKNSKLNTSHIDHKVYFDDIGCMVLWTKKHKKSPKEAMVFTKDTQRYIKATDAHYTINERTPMGYGFTAYEKLQKGSIDFKEMRLRVLRGETMKNPKIRKQILGE